MPEIKTIPHGKLHVFASREQVFSYARYVESYQVLEDSHSNEFLRKAKEKLESAWALYEAGYTEIREDPAVSGWKGDSPGAKK